MNSTEDKQWSFVESSEQPLIVIYEFESDTTSLKLNKIAGEIVQELKSDNIPIPEEETSVGKECYIAIQLVVTNIDSKRIRRLYDVAKEFDEFKEYYISTVAPDRIRSLWS